MMTNGQSVQQGTMLGDQVERSRLLGQRPGVENIYHNISNAIAPEGSGILRKILGGIAGAAVEGPAMAGDMILARKAPEIEAMLPGSVGHYNRDLGRADTALTQDEANAQKQAQTAAENATAQHTAAETPEVAPNAESARGLQGAEVEHLGAEMENLKNPPANLAVAYAHAVQDAMKRGVDPSTDPIVGHLADAITSIQKQSNGKSMEHVSGTVAGKPAMANFHPDTGKYTDPDTGQEIAGFKPPPVQPNYGQLILPTKTATYIDQATGVPTEFQWNEKTNRYDIPVGQSATGGYGHEAAQAGAVERAGAELIQTLEANKKDLGTLGAWIGKYGLNTPIADPKLASIQTKLASFAALNPAMHGAKGLQAMEHFTRVIGGAQQNPDATIASIRAIVGTAHAINPGIGPQEGGGNAPQRPAGVPANAQYTTDPKTGKKGWAW
jgi:uncharacterized membrane protein YeaQ/YmgE (transglycosylase-associated protein family)